jgi:hypothetical protein
MVCVASEASISGGVNPQGHSQWWNGERPSPSTLIARYVLEAGVSTFRLEEVRYYWLERGVEVDRRRLHDAAKRLVARGILEKASRGLYRVKSWASLSLAAQPRNGGNGSFPTQDEGENVLAQCLSSPQTGAGAAGAGAGRRLGGFVPVWAGDGCLTVLRWHLRARRAGLWEWVWELFERAVAFRELFAWLVRWLRGELRRMGVSGYEVRRRLGRVLARVRALLRRVRPVIGAHYRGRFYPLKELLRLFAGLRRLPRLEFGVELWSCGEDGIGAAREGYALFGSQQVYTPNAYKHNTKPHVELSLRAFPF